MDFIVKRILPLAWQSILYFCLGHALAELSLWISKRF